MTRNTPSQRWTGYLIHAALAAVMAAIVAACGGGGSGDKGCTTIDPSRDTTLPGCSTSTTVPRMTVALTDSAGAAITTISNDRPGTLVAVFRNAANNVVAGTVVTFTTTDTTGVFVPASATAITDSTGTARVGLPVGTTAGAFTATATASVDGKTATATINYTVSYSAVTLSALTVAPTTLAAGGTAGVEVTVLSGTTPYAPPQVVTFSSPCVAAGKARLITPVTTVNGVASSSYTDLGCGTADIITATAVVGTATITRTASLTVNAASAGQLNFVSALPQNISLKGTGGAGRQETATVTFKVLNAVGQPLAGQVVNFALNTTVGGLTVSPASATTGSDGTVATVVSSGTINTPVRVSATLPGNGITTVSDQLVVSTGVPEQASFSLGALIRNIEGGSFNGCPAPNGTTVTARLADRFHNPAPDGTAVSFTAEGGTVDASCLTGETSTTLTDGTVIKQKGTPGECTVRFCAASPRPADGRVTVLAYALGEESFVDANGNNRFDAGEVFTDLGDPFRNDRAVTDANAAGVDDAYTSGNAVRVSGEAFIDTNGNSTWDATGNGIYNGVLRATGVGSGETVHLRQSMVMVLSNSTANVTLLDQAVNGAPTVGTLALSQCTNGTAFVNQGRTFRFAIRDNNPTVFATNRLAAHPNDSSWLFDRPGNPLPANTQITITTSNGILQSPITYVVPNSIAPDSSNWVYSVQLASDALQSTALVCDNRVASGSLTITVTTPSGVVSSFSYPVTD
jgi:hypothetical protein